MLKIYFILFLFVFIWINLVNSNQQQQINPYKILGLPRNANDKAIRNAYKKLAKEWHPDRNKAPDAPDRFMQINQAYEILSDEERRTMYDEYGSTSEPRQGQGHQGHGYHHENYDQFFQHGGFDSFFGGRGGGFRFNFNNNGHNNRKSSEEEINKKIYDEIILPQSHVKPFLIYSYTEFCMMCMTVESTWEQLKQEIKNIGFGAGHSDASWNRELSKTLGIHTVPSIVGIINQKVYQFNGEFTLKNLREFVRKLIPSKLVTDLNRNNFNQTLMDTLDENKVFALFVSYSNQLTLRYQMPCLQMINNIKCSSIKLNSLDSNFNSYLAENFNVFLPTTNEKQELLLLFKENTFLIGNKYEYRPCFQQQSHEISFANILQTFESNKFLNLPRLSSSQHFFDLCSSWSQSQSDFDSESPKIICVIFVTEKAVKTSSSFFTSNDFKLKLAKKVVNDDYFKKTAQFTYIYLDIQSDFIEKIVKNSKLKSIESNKTIFEDKIILLKRLNDKYAQFDIYDLENIKDHPIDVTKLVDSIKQLINSITIGTKRLSFKMALPEFYDESSANFFRAIIDYFEELWTYVTNRHFWIQLLGNSSYLMLLLCTVLFIWLMVMFSSDKSNPNAATLNQQQPQQKKKNSTSDLNHRNKYKSSMSSNSASNNDLSNSDHLDPDSEQESTSTAKNDDYKCNLGASLTEMTSQTYEALVRCLPNGYRTILLVVNKDRKRQLIDKFSQICSNYNNRSYHLRFAYLNADSNEGQKWLNDLVSNTYKQVDENDQASDNESGDSNNSSSNREIIDFKRNYIVLSINQQRKFYLMFSLPKKILNFRCRDEDNIYESSLGFSSELEDKFENELSNWLDKLTEGLNMNLNRYQVKKWPNF